MDCDFLLGGLLTFFGVDPTEARLSHGRAAIHLSIQLQPQLSVARLESVVPKLELECALHCKFMKSQFNYNYLNKSQRSTDKRV